MENQFLSKRVFLLFVALFAITLNKVNAQVATVNYTVDVSLLNHCPTYGDLQLNIYHWHLVVPPFNGYWELVATTSFDLIGQSHYVVQVPGTNACGQMKITTQWIGGPNPGIPYQASSLTYFNRPCDGTNPTIYIIVPVYQGDQTD